MFKNRVKNDIFYKTQQFLYFFCPNFNRCTLHFMQLHNEKKKRIQCLKKCIIVLIDPDLKGSTTYILQTSPMRKEITLTSSNRPSPIILYQNLNLIKNIFEVGARHIVAEKWQRIQKIYVVLCQIYMGRVQNFLTRIESLVLLSGSNRINTSLKNFL